MGAPRCQIQQFLVRWRGRPRQIGRWLTCMYNGLHVSNGTPRYVWVAYVAFKIGDVFTLFRRRVARSPESQRLPGANSLAMACPKRLSAPVISTFIICPPDQIPSQIADISAELGWG